MSSYLSRTNKIFGKLLASQYEISVKYKNTTYLGGILQKYHSELYSNFLTILVSIYRPLLFFEPCRYSSY